MDEEHKVEEPEIELKVVQVTNPNMLGMLSKEIEAFCGKINVPGITPQTLYAYFVESIHRGAVQFAQYGIDMEQFWVVYSGDETLKNPDYPIIIHAFAHWMKLGLPHVGKVYCSYMYSWNRKKDPARLLYQKFYEFGKKHRCTLYGVDASNEKLYEVFKGVAGEFNLNFERTPVVVCVGKAQNGK